MIHNAYCCYNDKLDVFEIRTNNFNKVISTQEYKYGIEVHFDVNMNPVAIIIPEPDVLFGIDVKILLNFVCNNFT